MQHWLKLVFILPSIAWVACDEKGTISDCGLTENAGNWTVSGSCRIQVVNVTDDRYACSWSQNTSAWPASFIADDPEARVNISGHCIFTRSLPPEEGVYTYSLHYQPAHDERRIVGNITINVTIMVNSSFGHNETKTLILTCVVTNADSEHNYTWTGIACDNGNHSNTCSFVARVSDDNGKVVTCNATPIGSQNDTLNLTYSPSQPVITGYNTSHVLTAGDSVSLTCTVSDGNPPVTNIIFHCRRRDTNATGEFNPTTSSSTLTIERLEVSDNGTECVCTASWQTNRTRASLSLTVSARTYTPLIALLAGGTGGGFIVLIICVIIIVEICNRCKGTAGNRKESLINDIDDVVEEHINILYEDSDLFMKTRQPSCSTTPSALSSPAAPSTSTFTVKTDEQETSFGYSSVELKTDEQTTSFGHVSVDNKTDEQKISFGYASVELKTNEEETSAGYASVDSGSPVKSAPRFALVNTDATGTSAGYSEVELEGSTNAKETAAKSSAVSTERRFLLEDRSGVSLFSPYSDVDPAYASAEDVFPSPPPCSTNRRITIADHSGSGLPSHYVNCPSNFDDTKPPSLCQPFSDANSGAYAVVNKVPKHARASQPPAYEYAKVNKKGRSRSAVYTQVERKKRAEQPPAPDRQSDFVHNVQVETEAQHQPGDIQHVVDAADGGESKDSTLNVEVQQLPSSDVGDVQHKLTGAAREEQHVNESD